MVPERVIRADPWVMRRYSVCFACQWRPEDHFEFGGRVMVVWRGVEGVKGMRWVGRVYVTEPGREKDFCFVVWVRLIIVRLIIKYDSLVLIL